MTATATAVKPSANGSTNTQPKGWKKVTATLKGLQPGFLMNPMTEEVLDALQTGTALKANKGTPPVDIAAKKVMRDDDGNPGIKIEYLLGCLAEAGRNVKNGKKQISTATSTTIYSFIDFGDVYFLTFSNASDYKVDIRRGVLQSGASKVAVPIVRPLFRQWEVKVEFLVDESECRVEVVKQLFESAGKKVGLGDFRPAKKGPFGRFVIESWEVE